MKVVPLSRYRNRETAEVLEALASRARDGEIVGVAMCFKRLDGTEDSVMTGSYATSPDLAAAATLRLSVKLANARGEYDLSP